MFSHPADYTPVCTTELARVVTLLDEFKKRDVELIALSCNDVESHHGWSKDVMEYAKKSPSDKLPYPIIADPDRKIAVALGMLDPAEKDKAGLPLTCRAVRITFFGVKPVQRVKVELLKNRMYVLPCFMPTSNQRSDGLHHKK